MPDAAARASSPWVDLDLEDGCVSYVPAFVASTKADELFTQLHTTLRWRQESVRIMGRRRPQPRLTCWYGDPGAAYTYSGLTLEPEPWMGPLQAVRAELEAAVGTRFGAVLANLYRDGSDSVAWHADDEPELGPEPVIASLSFGAARRFDLRRRDDHTRRHSVVLEHGSLLVLAGATQRHWQHQVPKARAVIGPRINLSFRTRAAAAHPVSSSSPRSSMA